MDVTIREDDSFVYADVFNAEPASELYIELRSKAVAPNESTEGVTAAMHKTVNASGQAHFKAPKDFVLPDVPREITVIGPLAVETFT